MGHLVLEAIEFSCDSQWTIGIHYRLWFTPGGNLLLWNDANRNIVWQSETAGSKLAMQENGNLAIYDAGGKCIWDTGTSGNQRAIFSAQDDGNLVIYSAGGKAKLWESGTTHK